MLTHIDLFAGILGFSLGFEQAGIKTVAAVENDPACQALIRRRRPDILLLDDVTTAGKHNLPWANIITFGSPCQDLSVAGKRSGLEGMRSGLFFEGIRICDELRPDFGVWENVPGAFSSNAGRDFASVLAAFRDIGARDIAWRTLDARYFGVAQRRRRVFLVADFRGERAAEVLFESARLPGHTPPRRETREGVAAAVAASAGHHGRSSPRGDGSDNLICFQQNQRDEVRDLGSVVGALPAEPGMRQQNYIATFGGNNTSGPIDVAAALNAHGGAGRMDFESETFVAATLNSGGHNGGFRTEPGEHIVLAFTERTRAEGRTLETQDDLAYALTNPGEGGRSPSRQIAGGFGVRRLTPTECERLQGFDDGWTAGQADSSRYRQLGNAVAVPCARWVGGRIVDALAALAWEAGRG